MQTIIDLPDRTRWHIARLDRAAKWALFRDAVLLGTLLWDPRQLRFEPIPNSIVDHDLVVPGEVLKAFHALIALTGSVPVDVAV